MGNKRPSTVTETQLKSAANMKIMSNISIYPGTQWAYYTGSGFSVVKKDEDSHDGMFTIQANGIAVDHNYSGSYVVAQGMISFDFTDATTGQTHTLTFVNGIMVSAF